MSDRPPAVAVVTVTYRSAADIEPFLKSVASASPTTPVFVVDNPSEQSGETIQLAERWGAQVVRLPENVGYGSAVNAAAKRIDPAIPFLLVSNPDVRLHQGAIEALVSALERRTDAGSIGPRILNEDGSVYPSARQIPSLRTGVGHALFFRIWPRNPWTRRYRDEGSPTTATRDVGWLSGAALLVRRSAFDQIGGFDERYFMYFEDVDLGYRLGRAGWKNAYEPAATVTHTGAQSTTSVRAQMLRAHHRSAQRFLDRKYAAWYLAPVRWTVHIGLDLRAWWLTRR